MHGLILHGHKEHGLFKGRHLGIDSSVVEANASLSGLASRNTEQSCRDHVKKLALEGGVGVEDAVEVETLEEMEGEPSVEGASSLRSLTADKGYHDIVELAQIEEQCGLRTVVGDAQADRRRKDKLEPEAPQALNKAARAVRSKNGKALLKARGKHIERGFAHVLDSGGLRRTTLRGREKINRRYLWGSSPSTSASSCAN